MSKYDLELETPYEADCDQNCDSCNNKECEYWEEYNTCEMELKIRVPKDISYRDIERVLNSLDVEILEYLNKED